MATKERKKLILLDSHAIIHRAYHALPDFASSTGKSTGALYGLSTMLLKIANDLSPDYIVACYDLPQKTFRHEVYGDYKAGRVKADDSLVEQLQSSRQIFEAFNIPIYDCPGFEADDILGTIVSQVCNSSRYSDIDIIISSGDMDTLQLVSGERVRVFTLKKGLTDTVMYNEEAVISRFGFSPQLLPDYKGLRGDTSDNIIGISGIGEKTATTLISSLGSVENIYKKIKTKKEEVKSLPGITDRILKLLEEGEEEALFSKTLATIRRDAPVSFSIPKEHWKESVHFERIILLLQELEFKSLISRFEKFFGKTSSQKEADFLKEDVSPEDVHKMAIAVWLLDSDKAGCGLGEILDFARTRDFSTASKYILEQIQEKKLSYVYEQIELPIIPIISKMEEHGVLIDLGYFAKLSKEYHTELEKIEKRIWKYVGEFNINSPKQLGEVLFDKLGLTAKGLRKSAGGSRSTRESELEKLQGLHPIIDDVFLYRERQKLLSTYIDSIPPLVATDGRLHARFLQDGTTTGRFSSQNPNLQNIPVKTELGKNIRYGFSTPAGKKMVSFDYSQIELRMAALLARDEYLGQVFRDNKDIHSAVAMKVFGVLEENVTHEMRRRAKVINFGILYGMGVSALQKNLGTDRKEAQAFYDNYFIQFPQIAKYMESTKEFAREQGYTETLFGRRRYFKDIKSKLPFIRAMAERMAINAPVQGSVADLIKIGMKNSYQVLLDNGLDKKAKLILQIHDELIYEVDEDSIEIVTKLVSRAMENAVPESFLQGLQEIPFRVSVGVGDTYGDLK